MRAAGAPSSAWPRGAATKALTCLAIAALALAFLPAVAAHADLASIDPPIDRTHRLAMPTPVFVLRFTERLDPATSSVAVYNVTTGQQVDLGPARVTPDPPMMELAMPTNLPPGTYILKYKATSTVDGHPNKQNIGFAYGDFEAPPSTSGLSDQVPPEAAASRAVLYVGLSIGLAAAAFLLWMPNFPPATARRALLVGATLHFVGVVYLFKFTAQQSEVEFGAYLASPNGNVYLARSILGGGAFLLAMLGVLRPTRSGPWAVTLLLLGAGIGAAWLGHAAESPVMRAIDFVHLVAAAVWVGGLLLLASSLRAQKDPEAARQAGVRFGTIAMTAVFLVVVAGLVLSVAILGWDALAHPFDTMASPYGAFLGGKVALAVLMVGLAGVNRYVLLEQAKETGLAGALQKAVHAGSRGRIKAGMADGRNFRRAVSVEAALGVVVLILAGLLTSVSPPSVVPPPPAPLELTGMADGYRAFLRTDPSPVAGADSELYLSIERIDANGTATPMLENTCGRPSCVSVTLKFDQADGPEPSRDALLHADGWYVHDVFWTLSGPATLTVTLSDPPVFSRDVVFPLTVPAAPA